MVKEYKGFYDNTPEGYNTREDYLKGVIAQANGNTFQDGVVQVLAALAVGANRTLSLLAAPAGSSANKPPKP